MSAEVEAGTADPTSLATGADQAKVQETSTVHENSAASNDGDDKKDKKPDYGPGREVDDKYSKNHRDSYSNKKRNGNSRSYGHYNKRHKFDPSNVKSRYDDQEKSSDPYLIRKQVEYYFSNANLKDDKFMWGQMAGLENKPVDLKVILTFKRMHRFEPYSAIVAAIKDSELVELVNGDKPNNEQVRRKIPLPENFGKSYEEVKANYDAESMKRSIYAKGFGTETSKTQIEVENFFAPYMASSVRLRRTNDGSFKGSVFVEFESEEDMQQFLDLEDKPEWEGKQLDIKSKTEYCQEKDKLINEGKIRRNDLDTPRNGRRGGKGGHRGPNRRDRDRSRSRSRSRGRRGSFHEDLKRKSWRELADEEEKERQAKKHKGDELKPEDDDATPKIVSTPSKDENAAANGKKRSLEEDDAQDGGEVKRVKSDDE